MSNKIKQVRSSAKKRSKVKKKSGKQMVAMSVPNSGMSIPNGWWNDPRYMNFGASHQAGLYRYQGNSPTYYEISKYTEGKLNGIRLKWRGPVFRMTNFVVAAVNYFGVYNTLGSTAYASDATGYAIFPVSPYAILPSASTATIAESYTRFRLDKLCFEWEGLAGTGTNYGVSMVYNPDGAFTGPDSTYVSCLSQSYVRYFSTWHPTWTFDLSSQFSNKDWFYCDTDNSSDAGLRDSNQGVAVFYVNGALTAGTDGYDNGIIYSSGEMILVDNQPFAQNVAFGSKRQAASMKQGQGSGPVKPSSSVEDRKKEEAPVEEPPVSSSYEVLDIPSPPRLIRSDRKGLRVPAQVKTS